MPIKVLCVDDSVDITRLITMAVSSEDDMEVVGDLQTAANLLDEVRTREPDVLLLDLTMPGTDVLEALGRISESCPDTRVVVYSGYDDQENMDSAMDAGAWGYVSKNVAIDALLQGIREVSQGKVIALR